MKNKFYYSKGQVHKLYSWLEQTLINTAKKGKVYELSIKEITKRSLNANAFYWACVEAIANATHQSNSEIHKQMIYDYSTSVVMSVRADVDISKYVKYYKECGKAELNGTEFIHYRIYKGSSDMTTKEFSRLLDGAIQEVESMGFAVDMWGGTHEQCGFNIH